MLVLLGQQIESPPMEGLNGWLIGLAITAIFSIVGNIWSEYQRRSERKDKKAEQQTVAEISAEQDRTRLEFESVKSIIEELKSYNTNLRTQCDTLLTRVQDLLNAVSERDASIRKRDEIIAGMQNELAGLKREMDSMKIEIKSLERSRDEALHKLDLRTEETNPK